MSEHFLLSRAAKTLNLMQVMRMTDAEAETAFRKVRWPETNGEPYCPKCGCATCYDCRRASGLPRWECKACRAGFGITGGTLFASRKLPLRMRRAEIGHHHHVAGPYLLRFAQEASWREDHRKQANGEQTRAISALAMKCKPSVDFCGYWQRGRLNDRPTKA